MDKPTSSESGIVIELEPGPPVEQPQTRLSLDQPIQRVAAHRRNQ
jgi:hypothetical protein